MANLNLSQFGENTSVSDADYTFVWDSAASISKKVSRNSWLNSGTLTSDAPVTISQTWNAVGQTFKALVVNAAGTSDANSASGSLLADFQVNAASKVSITKTGAVRFGDGGFEPGIARVALGTVAVSLLGFSQNHVSLGYYGGASNSPGVTVSSLGHFAWSSSATNSEATRDTILLRDGAANTLALRNGAAAQTFNVYGTSSASNANYARLALTCGLDGNATISTQALGTGTAGTVSINGVPVGLGKGNVSSNIAIGTNALNANSSGISNTFVGFGSGQATVATQYNTGVGESVLQNLNGGGRNTAIGAWALRQLTGGFENIAIGVTAGNLSTTGNFTSGDNNIFIGGNSKGVNAQNNQVVIGYDATGIGSNSVVLGNDSITKTALKGNVGIGTTAPSRLLSVVGNLIGANLMLLNNTNSAGYTELGFDNDTAFAGNLGGFVFGLSGTTTPTPNDAYFFNRRSAAIFFGTNSTERMRITGAGNVGIGTTAPSEKLDVAGNAQFVGTSPYLNLKSSTGGNYYIQSNANVIGTGSGNYLGYLAGNGRGHTWCEGSTSRMMIEPTTGNVGIGTTSPTSKLHVAETWNNAGTTFCAIKSVITDTNSAAGSDFLELYSGASTQPLRMDINKTGQINIYGAWTDASNYERLSFNAPSAANAVIGTNKAGTGTARGLEFQTDGVTRMTFSATASAVTFTNGINAGSGSTSVFSQAHSIAYNLTGGVYGGPAQFALFSPSDGVLRLTNGATTDVNRLQLGGTTDAFPAIARDGAGIKFTGAAAGSTSWIKVPPVAVSALPLAATAGAGARAFVNDASSPTFGSAVTGGGAVLVPVYSTGSAWNVG